MAYDSGVFYAKDAFEGLDIIDKLTNSADERTAFVQRVKQEALTERLRKATPATENTSQSGEDARTPSASIKPALSIPTPPFWGIRVLERIGLEDVA